MLYPSSPSRGLAQVPLRFIRILLTSCLFTVASPLIAAKSPVLTEGDIVVVDRASARSIYVGSATQRWPSGVIPYTIDPALPANSQLAIGTAIEHWNKVGGISLLPLEEAQKSSSAKINDSVRFISGDYCASWVGRRGGQQNLWVASYCPAGSVMHEIGHLLGLEHEHTRFDRDQYIQIHWDNIEADKQHNFDAAPAGSTLPGAYDYDSIMHYGTHNFSSNGKATITAVDGTSRSIGQRVQPSSGDLQAIAQLYGSDLSLIARVSNVDPGAELELYVSNQSSQGAHNVSVDIGLSADEVVLPSGQDGWSCRRTLFGSVTCDLPRLPGSAVELLRLPLSATFPVADIDVTLSSKTPDFDPSNNTSKVLSTDVAAPPQNLPLPEVAAALDEKTVIQEDAIGKVAKGSGPISVPGLLALLLLITGQASRRVNLVVFSKHGRNLRCR